MEAVHFGLNLPGTISSFGSVNSVSVSNWTAIKRGTHLSKISSDSRATYFNKVELFNMRQHLQKPNSIHDDHLADLSFYAFWRMYDVNKMTIKNEGTKKSLL